jgi:tetratricopeptide (TPR) repeat protein
LQAEVFRAERRPRQTTALEFADTLAWLGLGGFAMGVLEEARLWYPESTSVPAAMAGAWDMYGFYEDALYALRRIGGGTPALRLRLYVRTGRFVEARKLAFAEGLEVPSTAAVRQGEVLPPAAQALEWRSGGLTDSLCAKMISDLTAQLPKCTSPYVKGLWQKQLDWYRARGAGDTSNQQAWEAVGRDPREKAEALKTLGLLLGAQGRLAEARAALEAAVRHAPRWSVLRRMQVALAQGDAEIVEQAWASCPWEGEVWLGHLVQRFRKQGAGPWAAAEVRAAVDGKRYNPGTFVRAGDFLFAGRMPDAAAAAAQHALAEGDGLLAAYAFGLRCALVQTNRAWALECALGGAERAVEPWPFHKAIVALKTVETKMDADLVRSLEALIAHFPDEYRWSEMLGHAYFRRGEPANAFAVLDRLLRRAGPEKVDKEALLVAAEAARLEGSTARSLELLAAAYRLYPDDLSVLNNYVYYLAQNPAQVARALDLLPELLRKGEKRFFAYDTAAMVSLKAGQLDKAELYMERAVDLVDPARYGWHEVYLNAAELQLSLGNYRDARDYLTRVRKDARRTPAVENRARDLLAEVARREREAQPRN